MNRRITSNPLENFTNGRLSRRSSLKIKEITTVFPKTNFLLKTSRHSPEKIMRSESTKISKLGRSQQYTPFEDETKIQKSMQNTSRIPHLKMSQSKISKKSLGKIKAYSTNIFNSTNSQSQCRISIVTSLKKAQHKDQNICFFAVFEGNSGTQCSTFLRDNLHLFIARQKTFPEDILTSMKEGLKNIQEQFTKISRKTLNDSGSSLVMVITRDQHLYIANIGDCKAILSSNLGEQITKLTSDHTPHNQNEFARIMKNGGMISKQRSNGTAITYYVIPGYKKTTRSIGNIQHKIKHSNLLTSQAQFFSKIIDDSYDFLLLGTDKLFTNPNFKQTIKKIWTLAINDNSNTIHTKAGYLIKQILIDLSKQVQSLGGILILFKEFQKTFFDQQLNSIPMFE